MIKYFCNLCKKEIKSGDMSIVQTKNGEQITTVHLHKRCLTSIKKLCVESIEAGDISLPKKFSRADEQAVKVQTTGKQLNTSKSEKVPIAPIKNENTYGCKGDTLSVVTGEEKFPDIKKPQSAEKSTEKLKVTDEELDAVLSRLSKAEHDSYDTTYSDKHEIPAVASEDNQSKEVEQTAIKLKIESFNDTPSTSKPRNIPNIQRILLCLYKGMTLKETSDRMSTGYQNIVIVKNKYAYREIAMRHLKAARMENEVCTIIDEFIKTGNIEAISIDLGISVNDIKDTLEYYTGFSC